MEREIGQKGRQAGPLKALLQGFPCRCFIIWLKI